MIKKLPFISLIVPAFSLILFLGGVRAALCQDSDVEATVDYRGDAGHSGYSATKLPRVLSVLWQNTLPDVTTAYSTPAVSNGILYVGAGPHVFALNVKDGSIKWQYPADGTKAQGDFDSPPAVADGKLFIGSNNNNLSVFDSTTGALLWQVQTSGYIVGAPTVHDGTVFFGCSDKNLYAIKESNQQPLWAGVFHTGGPLFSSPCVANGLLWFADGNGTVYGVRLSTGGLQWTYLPPGGVSPGGVILRNDVLYASSGANVVSLLSRSGALKSEFSVPSIVAATPTIGDSNIYVSTTSSDIYSLGLRGNIVWKTQLGEIVDLPMQLTDSYLYAVSRNGVVYALDPATGTVVWSNALLYAIAQPGSTSQITKDTLPQAHTNTPCVAADGKLFVLTNDGTVTAFTGTAADNVPPQVLATTPQEGTTVAGANVQFEAFVTDAGSGIDPATVSLKVDGAPVPVVYDSSFSLVSLQYLKSSTGASAGRITLPTLPDGQRTAVLSIADWRGNVMTKTWSFTVDNSQNPPGSPAPTPINANTFQQADTPAGNGDASGTVTYPGGATGAPATGQPATPPGGPAAPNGTTPQTPPSPPPGMPATGPQAFPPPPPGVPPKGPNALPPPPPL